MTSSNSPFGAHDHPAQPALDLPERGGAVERVNRYTFEPIRGYPMLQWAGKRPFRSTQYYPAQHKETYGSEVDGWRNRLYWGDNLQVMSHLLKQYRGHVQLIYIDPPFDSKADYAKVVKVRGKRVTSDKSAFEDKQYTDIWTNDEYLQFMYERLILVRELMSKAGTIYVHLGPNISQYVKVVMDEVFGQNNYVNEVVWRRAFGHSDSMNYGVIHDSILVYGASSDRTWNRLYHAPDRDYVETFFDGYDEERGERYQRISLSADGLSGGGYEYEYKGAFANWRCPLSTLERYDREGRLHWPKKGVPRLKRFESEYQGVTLQDIWTDVAKLHNQSSELLGYPTQKPEALLERIIRVSSNPGDLVFDCFMGSGTTQAVATKLGRRFLGADINLGAVQITTKRLIAVAAELQAKQQQTRPAQPQLLSAAGDVDDENDDNDENTEGADGGVSAGEHLPTTRYTGFEVYNVNNYDVFRNPVQARTLLLEALEINPLPAGSLFDGERDGRMWKLMPINRIATRQDLNDLITGFDQRTLQRRQAEAPNRPVEKVTLVCMGHEPDLAAHLKQEMSPFLLDVEVLDILRDKQAIQFKRDSEAVIVVRDGQLIIEAFYPMTLLSKLSQQKEDVTDWRELVDSVMIDWNYDGAVLEPTVVDVPADDAALVAGRYPIPPTAGTIRVKITDLLSDSLELEVQAHA